MHASIIIHPSCKMSTLSPLLIEDNNNSNSLSSDMKRLYESGRHTDVMFVFRVGDQKEIQITSHQLILSARSKTFAKMLEYRWLKNAGLRKMLRIDLSTFAVDPVAFEHFIKVSETKKCVKKISI